MRTLLLALAIAAIGAADTTPFSHQAPTANADTCLKCHRGAIANKPAAAQFVRFDHQLHQKLGNIAPTIAAAIDHKAYLAPPGPLFRDQLNSANPCIACHRGMDASGKSERATQSRMADCLVCHNQIDPPDSCEFCHAKGAKLRPANHTPDFLDTHTSGKLNLDKATCAVCHGRTFRCLGCH